MLLRKRQRKEIDYNDEYFFFMNSWWKQTADGNCRGAIKVSEKEVNDYYKD